MCNIRTGTVIATSQALALGVGRSPSIHASPVACSILEGLARACKLLRDLGIHGVIWLRITEFRSTEEGLEGDEQDRQGDIRGPLILEDVRVVDLGDELHFGRCKGIVVWEDDVLQRRDQAMRDALVAKSSTWRK
jgi:hypothetical protein